MSQLIAEAADQAAVSSPGAGRAFAALGRGAEAQFVPLGGRTDIAVVGPQRPPFAGG